MTARAWFVLLTVACARPAAGQVTLALNAGYLDRRLLEAGSVERQAGGIGGAAVAFRAAGVGLAVSASAGKLAAKSAATEDADYGRLSADVGLHLGTAVSFWAGAAASVYVTPVGAQRWILPRFGVELRVPFASIPGNAYVAGAALLGGTTNAVARARGGTDVRVGFATSSSPVGVWFEYHIERLRFASATAREEQRGEIMAGLRLIP